MTENKMIKVSQSDSYEWNVSYQSYYKIEINNTYKEVFNCLLNIIKEICYSDNSEYVLDYIVTKNNRKIFVRLFTLDLECFNIIIYDDKHNNLTIVDFKSLINYGTFFISKFNDYLRDLMIKKGLKVINKLSCDLDKFPLINLRHDDDSLEVVRDNESMSDYSDDDFDSDIEDIIHNNTNINEAYFNNNNDINFYSDSEVENIMEKISISNLFETILKHNTHICMDINELKIKSFQLVESICSNEYICDFIFYISENKNIFEKILKIMLEKDFKYCLLTYRYIFLVDKLLNIYDTILNDTNNNKKNTNNNKKNINNILYLIDLIYKKWNNNIIGNFGIDIIYRSHQICKICHNIKLRYNYENIIENIFNKNVKNKILPKDLNIIIVKYCKM